MTAMVALAARVSEVLQEVLTITCHGVAEEEPWPRG